MTVPSDGLLPETIAERIEGDAPAVTAAADAISREYGATDGRLRSRWSRDLAITALEAAEPFITGPAVAAERERCAALLEARAATTTADLMTVGWSRPQIAAMRHLCHAVAKEIRERGGETSG